MAPIYPNSRNAIGVVSINVKTTLQNHITTISLTVSGISVPIIHGTDAEKKSISEMHKIPVINLLTIGDPALIIAGTYISASDVAAPFAANMGSGICSKLVSG